MSSTTDLKSEISSTKIDVYADGVSNIEYMVFPHSGEKKHVVPLPRTADIELTEAYWKDESGTLVEELTITAASTSETVSAALSGTLVKMDPIKGAKITNKILIAKGADGMLFSDPLKPTTCTVVGGGMVMEGTISSDMPPSPMPVVRFQVSRPDETGLGAVVTFPMSMITWSLHHDFFIGDDTTSVFVARWLSIENRSDTSFKNATVVLYRTMARSRGNARRLKYASMSMESASDVSASENEIPLGEDETVGQFEKIDLVCGCIVKKPLGIEQGIATIVHFAVVENIPSSSEASRELRVSGLRHGIVAGEQFVVKGGNRQIHGMGTQHRTYGGMSEYAVIKLANTIGVTVAMTESTSPTTLAKGYTTTRTVKVENHTPNRIKFELRTRDRAFGADTITFNVGMVESRQTSEDGFHILSFGLDYNEKKTATAIYLFKPKEVVVHHGQFGKEQYIAPMSQ